MKKLAILLVLVLSSTGLWAQLGGSKVSNLPRTTTVDSSDLLYYIDGGKSRSITWYTIAQNAFPVDVRTNAAGQIIFESFWIGEDAGLNHTSAAYYNFGIGTRALYALTSGTANTALGYNAGYNITTGVSNHLAGFQTGYGIDTSGYNIAIGHQSMYSANGFANIGIGRQSARAVTGEQNIFAGWKSGYSAGDADFNVGIGSNSLYALTTGNYNVSISDALGYLTTGSYAIGIGWGAADTMSNASILAIGAYAGQSTMGVQNTFVGENSASWLKAGVRNSVFGYNSMTGAYGSDGDDNAIFGAYAGNNLGASADKNTHLGAYAGDGQTTGSGTVKIGYQAGLNDNTSNTLWISNSSDATPLIWGNFVTDSSRNNGTLTVRDSLYINNFATRITKAASGNLHFTDAVTGTKTLAELATNTTYNNGSGITIDGSNNIDLGGTLDANTTITAGEYDLTWAGTTGDIWLEGNAFTFETTNNQWNFNYNGVGTAFNIIPGDGTDYVNLSALATNDLRVRGGSTTTTPGDLSLSAGNHNDAGTDGDIYIGYESAASATRRVDDIFLGNGSNSISLDAKVAETNVVFINTTTGALSYGEVDGALSVTSLAASGTITGLTDVTLDTDATVVLAAGDCDNALRINNDADVIDYTLPAAATGLTVRFYDKGGGVITIDVAAGDEICLNGVDLAAGNAIDSPGAVGNSITLIAIDDTHWITQGRNGTWIDGGA